MSILHGARLPSSEAVCSVTLYVHHKPHLQQGKKEMASHLLIMLRCKIFKGRLVLSSVHAVANFTEHAIIVIEIICNHIQGTGCNTCKTGTIIKSCYGLIVRLRLQQWPTWQFMCVYVCVCADSASQLHQSLLHQVLQSLHPNSDLESHRTSITSLLKSFLCLFVPKNTIFSQDNGENRFKRYGIGRETTCLVCRLSASSGAPQSAATGGGSSRGASSALSWRDGDGVGEGGTSEVPDSLCFSWTAHKAFRLPVNF